ncbi:MULTISPECIES: hypothetical protein [Pseudomonas]|uniref:hypothetical protein n=1 Tax=Pseudomonas TaxID=286 RepID=UPI00235F8CBF|nr:MULTISPECIES: hypothetical protein [Pseudomonas]WJV23187.1 hypothetical protein PSR66_26705 [Pseudomonas chlororaphis]
MHPEQPIFVLIQANSLLLSIACFGGLVLFALKIVDHFNRAPENKLSSGRYVAYMLFLFVVLPVLGSAVVAIYLANGDKISPVLAFQVGLTSPAIVQSMIIAAANNLAKEPVSTIASQ